MTTPNKGHESGGGGVMTKLLILLRRNPPLLLFCAFVLVVVTGRIANLDNRSSEHPTLDALPRSALQSIADVATRLAPPGTAYRGTTWHNERTVAVDTLGETKFARCDVHTVCFFFIDVLRLQLKNQFRQSTDGRMLDICNY